MSASESGDSETVSAFDLPPPQPCRRCSSSGRAVAEHEQRDALRALDELVDEVEQRVVRPVQVLEHEDERALFGHSLEEPAPRRERLLWLDAPSSRKPGERTQLPLDPLRLGRVAADVVDGARELLLRARAVSLSRMPACALTISASAQNVTPSPYGQRATLPPADELASSSTARNSS